MTVNELFVWLVASAILNAGLLLLFLWSESEYKRILKEWGETIEDNEKALNLLKKYVNDNERLMKLMGI